MLSWRLLAGAGVTVLAACGSARSERLVVTPDTSAGDLVEGILHVPALEAYLEDDTRRIRLVAAPPQTARVLEVLLHETARRCAHSRGQGAYTEISSRKFCGQRRAPRMTGSSYGTLALRSFWASSERSGSWAVCCSS